MKRSATDVVQMSLIERDLRLAEEALLGAGLKLLYYEEVKEKLEPGVVERTHRSINSLRQLTLELRQKWEQQVREVRSEVEACGESA